MEDVPPTPRWTPQPTANRIEIFLNQKEEGKGKRVIRETTANLKEVFALSDETIRFRVFCPSGRRAC